MDPHDRHFRSHHYPSEEFHELHHSYSGSSHSSDSPEVPQPLHSEGKESLNDDSNHMGPIKEETDDFSRRGSSAFSVTSRLSEREIYGDMDAGEIALTREQTRASILSRISKTESRAAAGQYQGTGVRDDELGGEGEEYADLDPELVTWDGPHDPNNPRNWSKRKKILTTAVVAAYTTISPMSSSIISPAIPKVAQAFDIKSTFLSSLTVSIFVLAWAICPLFTAPMSEVFGRKIVLDISIVFLLIFNIACAVSQSTAQLMVFRFLAGVGGAPPLSVGAGVLADLFDDENRNAPLAWYSLGPTLGPIIAPIISGWISQYANWRWVFWALVIMNGATFAAGALAYEESYSTVLLQRKAAKLRKETGNSNLHTLAELTRPPLKTLVFNSVLRPLKMLAMNPIIQGLGLYMAFLYGFMYLCLVCYPALWKQYYGYESGISGTLYLCPGIGSIIGLAIFTPLLQKTYQRLLAKNHGNPQPEFRVFWLSASGIVCSVGLFWYGWAAQARMMWLMPGVGIGIFFSGITLMFMCVQNYLIDMNPKFAASAVAAAAVFRSMFGFGFPLFGTAMYDKLGYGWANTLCGLLCIVLGIPFPLFIYFYGHKVRRWTDIHVYKQNPVEEEKYNRNKGEEDVIGTVREVNQE